MPLNFLATSVATVIEMEVRIVHFAADTPEGEHRYLMLQRCDEYDEQSIRLGMDDVYIEYCDQIWSWYGHILSFVLLPNAIQVQLDAQAAKHIENDGAIHVGFSLKPARYQELRAELQHIFRDCVYYEERTGD